METCGFHIPPLLEGELEGQEAQMVMKTNEKNDLVIMEKEKNCFQTNMTEMKMGQCSQKQDVSNEDGENKMVWEEEGTKRQNRKKHQVVATR
jgi:hypothetical protein